MNIWFLAAGMASFAVCLLHIFGGGKIAARPLLDSTMQALPKYTNYYCWHLITITIAGMGAMFTVSAFGQEMSVLAWPAIFFAAAFSLWNIALYIGVQKKLKHWYDLPQWVLFTPIAALGFMGFVFA